MQARIGYNEKLLNAVDQALTQIWDKQNILDYARANSWNTRVDILVDEFEKIVNNE